MALSNKPRLKIRRLHRALGIALLIPCLLWAVTGLLFHWKPGWSEAYASLSLPTYPLETHDGAHDPAWLETRRLRSVLGEHLLVKTTEGWQQWDESTGAPRPEPSREDRRRLFEGAIASNPERYGSLLGSDAPDFLDNWSASTSTGVEVSFDWPTMRFRQEGNDTRRINNLYRVHYLQWTGTALGDKVVPLIGLIALAGLSLLGLRLAFRR